jgi:hypothetical protein
LEECDSFSRRCGGQELLAIGGQGVRNFLGSGRKQVRHDAMMTDRVTVANRGRATVISEGAVG